VGMPLLEAACVRSAPERAGRTVLQVFTGLPAGGDFEQLRSSAGDGAAVDRFTPEFLSYLRRPTCRSAWPATTPR